MASRALELLWFPDGVLEALTGAIVVSTEVLETPEGKLCEWLEGIAGSVVVSGADVILVDVSDA